MDPDLREALDLLESRLRVHVDITAAGLRDEIVGVREHADVMAAGVRAHADATAAGLRAHVDATTADMRRHFDVVAEGLRSDFRVATEGIPALDRRLAASLSEQDRTERRVDLLEARVTALERRRRPPRRRR